MLFRGQTLWLFMNILQNPKYMSGTSQTVEMNPGTGGSDGMYQDI